MQFHTHVRQRASEALLRAARCLAHSDDVLVMAVHTGKGALARAGSVVDMLSKPDLEADLRTEEEGEQAVHECPNQDCKEKCRHSR